MPNMILDERPKDGLERFKTACRDCGYPYEALGPTARADLESRWYASLGQGEPDYAVYSSPLYLAEAWECWVGYSRKYLRAIAKIAASFGSVRRGVDLGCGVGITTAALAGIFPAAEIIGTNFSDSPQAKVARWYGERYRFTVVEAARPSKTDLVFASEFFEHIQTPIRYLRGIIGRFAPRIFVVANAFNTTSTGHFPTYQSGDLVPSEYDGRTTSRLFTQELRSLGYSKRETGFWNNRPAIWETSK